MSESQALSQEYLESEEYAQLNPFSEAVDDEPKVEAVQNEDETEETSIEDNEAEPEKDQESDQEPEKEADESQEEEADASQEDGQEGEPTKSIKLDFGGKEVDLVVNGDLSEDEISELKVNFLRSEENSKRSEEVKAERLEVDKIKQGVSNLGHILESELMYSESILNSEEMQDLKEYNEAEYNQKVLDLQRKRDLVTQFKQARDNEYIQQQLPRIEQLTPGWIDQEIREKEIKQAADHWRKQGDTEREIKEKSLSVSAHADAIKAIKYDEIIAKAKANKDKTPPASSKASSTNKKPQPEKEKSLYDYFSEMTK